VKRNAIVLIYLCAAVLAPHSVQAADSVPAGSASWSLLLGGGSARAANRGLAWHAGPSLSVGVGKELALGVSTTFTGFLESMPNSASYFVDLPLSLTGFFKANDALALALSGGVGVGFSDLPAWTKSNRALTGHLAIAACLFDYSESRLWLELRMVKAATSTANVTFGFLALRYAMKL
jgi:hypothetical protein